MDTQIIVANLSGGLGNQLFKFFGAVNFSLRINQELKLNVDWYSDSNFQNGLTAKRQYRLSEFSEINQHLFYSADRDDSNALSPGPFRRLFRNRVNSFQLVDEEIFWNTPPNKENYMLTGNFESISYLPPDEVVSKYLNSLTLNEASKFICEEIRTQLPIIVHIRLTDYLNFPEVYPIASTNYYQAAINECIARTNTKNVWVISDDVRAAKNFFSKLNLEITYGKDDSIDSPVNLMYLMSQGAALVMGNSTFSWWAGNFARLNNKEIPIVLPNIFTHLKDGSTEDLTFSGWTRRDIVTGRVIQSKIASGELR